MREAATKAAHRAERDTRVTWTMKIWLHVTQDYHRRMKHIVGVERTFYDSALFLQREDPTAAVEAIRDHIKANEHQIGKLSWALDISSAICGHGAESYVKIYKKKSHGRCCS